MIPEMPGTRMAHRRDPGTFRSNPLNHECGTVSLNLGSGDRVCALTGTGTQTDGNLAVLCDQGLRGGCTGFSSLFPVCLIFPGDLIVSYTRNTNSSSPRAIPGFLPHGQITRTGQIASAIHYLMGKRSRFLVRVNRAPSPVV